RPLPLEVGCVVTERRTRWRLTAAVGPDEAADPHGRRVEVIVLDPQAPRLVVGLRLPTVRVLPCLEVGGAALHRARVLREVARAARRAVDLAHHVERRVEIPARALEAVAEVLALLEADELHRHAF